VASSLPSSNITSVFCLASNAVSGANNVLLELTHKLNDLGQTVQLFSPFAEITDNSIGASTLKAESFEAGLQRDHDFMFLTKPFMMPLALRQARKGKTALFALDHEPFDDPGIQSALSLPIPIIATSKYVQHAIGKTCGKETYYMPLPLDHDRFRPLDRTQRPDLIRVLMVGDYLIPLKGMIDGFAAVQKLSLQMNVQLVLITQQERQRQLLDQFDYPVEFHHRPKSEEIPSIYNSCDVLLCTSWHENFPLPPLEAFACGIPVVSTRNFGVNDYAIDGENCLLAETKNSDDLFEKLHRLLTDKDLANRLVSRALVKSKEYNWQATIDGFLACQQRIRSLSQPHPLSENAMQRVLSALELSGQYTPDTVRKHCHQLYNALRSVCSAISRDNARDDRLLDELKRIRDDLKTYQAQPGTLYYKSVKRRYDLCQLMIGVWDDAASLRLSARMGVE